MAAFRDLCRLLLHMWQGYDIAQSPIADYGSGSNSVWKAPLWRPKSLIPRRALLLLLAEGSLRFGPMVRTLRTGQ